MTRNIIQRVAAIHDLSGFGKASLTVVIPALSSMGIQVCPLPTAVLSAHTGFKGFTFLDLTDEMIKIINHWKALNLSFDAIYSGFLGSPKQVEIVSDFIRWFGRSRKTLIVVDPVMGDNGILYETINQEMVEKMRELASVATIITPNLTELVFLAGVGDTARLTQKDIEYCVQEISVNGPRYVVVTSVPTGYADVDSVAVYDRDNNLFRNITYKKLQANFAGTGDVFTSILVGHLLRGKNIFEAVESSVKSVFRLIEETMKLISQNKEFEGEEIVLEKIL